MTGDGELLMNVGSLATVAIMHPPNLSIVCVDNGHYGETGYQKSHTSLGVDLAAIAAEPASRQCARSRKSRTLPRPPRSSGTWTGQRLCSSRSSRPTHPKCVALWMRPGRSTAFGMRSSALTECAVYFVYNLARDATGHCPAYEENIRMPIKLGIHTGPQNLSMAELHRLWKRADAAGFHWISVWDHFYANPMVQQQRDPCFEAVATMASLASLTSRVRVACLVFCTLFRNPGLLAKAAVTVDHISNGRCDLGVGVAGSRRNFASSAMAFRPSKSVWISAKRPYRSSSRCSRIR